MASQPVMNAAARESRANAREDMAVLTAGAREKVDSAMANMQALGTKMLHPLDKTKKQEADDAAEQQKKAARDKRDEIRSVATQQAATERSSARGLVAKGVAETGGSRYPVLVTDQSSPSSHSTQTQDAVDSGSHDSNQTPGSATSDSNRLNQPVGSEERLPDLPATSERDGTGTGPVEETQEHASEVEGAKDATDPPPPVSPPSRSEGSEEREGHGGKAEEGVEDADYYPPTRIVQT